MSFTSHFDAFFADLNDVDNEDAETPGPLQLKPFPGPHPLNGAPTITDLSVLYEAHQRGEPTALQWSEDPTYQPQNLTPEESEQIRRHISKVYPCVAPVHVEADDEARRGLFARYFFSGDHAVTDLGHDTWWQHVSGMKDYLGVEWENNVIWPFQAASGFQQPSYLLTQLMPHQLSGVDVTLQALQKDHPLRGCIVGDEMRCGKIIQTIVSITEAKKRKIIPKTPVLIISTTASIPQRENELQNPKAWKEGCGPKFMVLRGRRPLSAAHEIVDGHFDFILITMRQLVQQHRELKRYMTLLSGLHMTRDVSLLSDEIGLAARFRVQKNMLQPTNVGVHSSLWADLAMPWTIVIDEAHTAQRATTRLHADIKAILTNKAIALTGKFVPA